jgi:hypothetical protein
MHHRAGSARLSRGDGVVRDGLSVYANPSSVRWSRQSRGRRVSAISLLAVSPAGCFPARIAAQIPKIPHVDGCGRASAPGHHLSQDGLGPQMFASLFPGRAETAHHWPPDRRRAERATALERHLGPTGCRRWRLARRGMRRNVISWRLPRRLQRGTPWCSPAGSELRSSLAKMAHPAACRRGSRRRRAQARI